MIKENVAKIQSQISSICQKVGRNPNEVTLVAVTKYSDASKIKEALEAGVTDIAENRVQDAKEKFPILDTLTTKVTRHLIGHLQTNKAKLAVQLFDVIQSVDSLNLAQELEKQAAKLNKKIDILIQINIAEEEQKFGASKDEAIKLIENVSQLPHLQIKGLMTMAPYTEDKDLVRRTFRGLRELRDQAKEKFSGNEKVQMKYLSMGMSGDYDIAIEEGANIVRIGSAIFK